MSSINIVDAVKHKADRIAESRKQKKLDKLERILQETKREEDRLIAEQDSIKEKQQRLMGLSQQELLVEAIMAIRGFYQEFCEKLLLWKVSEAQFLHLL